VIRCHLPRSYSAFGYIKKKPLFIAAHGCKQNRARGLCLRGGGVDLLHRAPAVLADQGGSRRRVRRFQTTGGGASGTGNLSSSRRYTTSTRKRRAAQANTVNRTWHFCFRLLILRANSWGSPSILAGRSRRWYSVKRGCDRPASISCGGPGQACFISGRTRLGECEIFCNEPSDSCLLSLPTPSQSLRNDSRHQSVQAYSLLPGPGSETGV
jgi:hypothetical protein